MSITNWSNCKEHTTIKDSKTCQCVDTIEEVENDYCFFPKLLKGTLKQGPLLLIFYGDYAKYGIFRVAVPSEMAQVLLWNLQMVKCKISESISNEERKFGS